MRLGERGPRFLLTGVRRGHGPVPVLALRRRRRGGRVLGRAAGRRLGGGEAGRLHREGGEQAETAGDEIQEWRTSSSLHFEKYGGPFDRKRQLISAAGRFRARGRVDYDSGEEREGVDLWRVVMTFVCQVTCPPRSSICIFSIISPTCVATARAAFGKRSPHAVVIVGVATTPLMAKPAFAAAERGEKP